MKKITDKKNKPSPRWGRLYEATEFGMSRSSLYRLRGKGKIIVSKVDGTLLWDLHSIARLIESNIQETPATPTK